MSGDPAAGAGEELARIDAALAGSRFETARRLSLRELTGARGGACNQLLRRLHDALRSLGDFAEAVRALEAVVAADRDEELDVILSLADDHHRLSDYTFYRGSEAERSGITGDEYAAQMQARSAALFDRATALCRNDADRTRVAALLRRCGRKKEAEALAPVPCVSAPLAESAPKGGATGRLAGSVRLPAGPPAAGVPVVLGLAVSVEEVEPGQYLRADMHYNARIGAQDSLRVMTDAAGRFCFEAVPAGRHEFLAVLLDPEAHDQATRFLAHGIEVQAGSETRLDLTASEWRSAPPREVPNPWPETLVRQGTTWQRVAVEVLKNPFHYDFPRQSLTLALPAGTPDDPAGLLVLSSHAPEVPLALQVVAPEEIESAVGIPGADPEPLPTGAAAGRVALCYLDLPACTDRVVALYRACGGGPGESAVAGAEAGWGPVPEAGGLTATIDTGRACFRIPWGEGTEALPPLLAVKGADGVWRGRGRFRLPAGLAVSGRCTRVVESGPLRLQVEVAYTIPGTPGITFLFTAHRNEPYLLAREVSLPAEGAAFEFSLDEFAGGRGYLHWSTETGSPHWSTLSRGDRLLARLQEQTPWWIPPQGFAYAMTADGLRHQDYIGVFSVRCGDWVDRVFERLSNGPGDDPPERRELDWPFPEMVGSTVSMITAHTDADGDAFFRFGFFDGERQWGILVSTLERNDGPFKELWEVQQKSSSPRLDVFRRWRLDEQDHEPRPHGVARREELRALRRKKASPVFGPVWEKITGGARRGPVAGLRVAVDGDPLLAWHKKRELVGVARVRCRMTLLGRTFGDMYSPVGGRAITEWAEEYDLIAGSGVFTPDEERLVRQFFMLMGHLYRVRDFMNWRFNSRNANFEADRVDIVGTIGLVFAGNPDADAFVRHGIALMERTINAYCTPGSGKWYENPSCYYLQALKCRVNFAYQLARRGVFDPTTIPRFKDFLRWGVLMLMPPCPMVYDTMRDGTDDYRAAAKVRRIAPIGDHANVGPWVPEHFALMSTLYRRRDPKFADLLLWAYQSGGCDGGYFGNLPLLFSALQEADLKPAPAAVLTSRRLEGFGSVMRGDFNSEREFYLLIKQGPGGYRYHRTEGSLVLFADGRPLIYDGGEAGETWRHSTLSFGATHMPLAPGHVERFRAFPAVELSQGVHPVALRPGEPVFLSDRCEVELAELALRRYHEAVPADSRSVVWVKDGYIVLHDDLHLPPDVESFWHLQVVAQSHAEEGPGDHRFRGRFGTDLQVLLPGQAFEGQRVSSVPTLDYHRPPGECFAMLHLAVDGGRQRSGYLAVLRPMGAGTGPVQAQALWQRERLIGVAVLGEGLDDLVLMGRDGLKAVQGEAAFEGRYGQVLKRPGALTLILADGLKLSSGGCEVVSTGPAVSATFRGRACEVVAEGQGEVFVAHEGRTRRLNVAGRLALRWEV